MQVFAAHALDFGNFVLVCFDFCLGGFDGGVQLAGAGFRLAGAALQPFQRRLVQTDVFFVGKALHLLFSQFVADALALGGQAAGALAQFCQLGGVGCQLGFRLQPGVLRFGFGGGACRLGGGLGSDLRFQRAGIFGKLGGGSGQAVKVQPGTQALGRGGHTLRFGAVQLGSQIVGFRLAGCQFLFGSGVGFVQLGQPLAQLVQLLLAAENADAAGGRTAGEGAARVDDLPVQRDDAVAVAEVARHGGRFGQVLDHDDASQQIVDNMLIFRFCLDQISGNLRRAGKTSRKAGALHGVQRQEGCASGALVLQKGDGGAGAALILDHDILQSKAEGGFNGNLIALLHGQDARHGTHHAAQPATGGGTHNRLDALLVAVHIALQVLEDMDALGGVGALFVRLLQGFGSLCLLAAAAVQFEF